MIDILISIQERDGGITTAAGERFSKSITALEQEHYNRIRPGVTKLLDDIAENLSAGGASRVISFKPEPGKDVLADGLTDAFGTDSVRGEPSSAASGAELFVGVITTCYHAAAERRGMNVEDVSLEIVTGWMEAATNDVHKIANKKSKHPADVLENLLAHGLKILRSSK